MQAKQLECRKTTQRLCHPNDMDNWLPTVYANIGPFFTSGTIGVLNRCPDQDRDKTGKATPRSPNIHHETKDPTAVMTHYFTEH